MDILSSFLLSVLAGVVACYLCKWLDGSQARTVDFSAKEGEPPEVLAILPGVHTFVRLMDTIILLPTGIIAYAEHVCNMLFPGISCLFFGNFILLFTFNLFDAFIGCW